MYVFTNFKISIFESHNYNAKLNRPSYKNLKLSKKMLRCKIKLTVIPFLSISIIFATNSIPHTHEVKFFSTFIRNERTRSHQQFHNSMQLYKTEVIVCSFSKYPKSSTNLKLMPQKLHYVDAFSFIKRLNSWNQHGFVEENSTLGQPFLPFN